MGRAGAGSGGGAMLGRVYSSGIRFRKIFLVFLPICVLKIDSSTNAFYNPLGVGHEESMALHEKPCKKHCVPAYCSASSDFFLFLYIRHFQEAFLLAIFASALWYLTTLA